MTDRSATPASQHLTALRIPHREFNHPGEVHSLAQAAAERGQSPDQVIRSILFRLGEGEYVLALAAGPRQIPWGALRKYLGRARLAMATPEEVLAVTGAPPGAVSPFGLPAPLRTLVDRHVTAQGEVSIGSGVRGTTIFIRVDDLLRALAGAEIVDFFQ
jgi:Cys-tRNA(Pro) deacylase